MKNRFYSTVILLAALGISVPLGAADTIELPEIGDSAGAIISPEQEHRLGAEYMRQIRRQAPVVTDEEVEDYIQALGTSLSKFTNYELGFHFFMLQSSVINAFALPGGYVAMHSGLMLETTNESELVSVVGHEIAHVTQRHGARMIEEASHMTAPMIASMVAGLALMAVNPQAGAGALMAGQAAAQQMQINFTRANEKEADALGIQLMTQANYDTQMMASFFERMQRASRYSDPAFIPEYLRTHPITINRIAEARNRAAQIKQSGVLKNSLNYYLIKAKLRVMDEPDPMQSVRYFQDALARHDNDPEEASHYGYVLALTEAGDFQKARLELKKLLAAHPKLIAFHLAAGRIEQRANLLAEGLPHFAAAYALEPESRAAVYGYVDALLLAGRPQEAKDLLGSYGLADRRDPKFYKLLADAQNHLGQTPEAHGSLAEYYYGVGEFPYAAEQLRLARESPGLNNYQRQKIVARLEEVENTLYSLMSDRR
jgi:beta-barrel assembly-enhancing protease